METVPYSDEDCDNLDLKYTYERYTDNEICLNKICDEHESYCVEKNFWGNCVEFKEKNFMNLNILKQRLVQLEVEEREKVLKPRLR